MLNQLGKDFQLTGYEIGLCAGTAFWGFTLAMAFGGLLVDKLGMRTLMVLAFAGHILGIGLTIGASGFWSLFISTLFVGLGNGFVEAACNPLVAALYPDNKTTMLNRFHVWFPGGIVIGGLVSYGMTALGLGWQLQMASILVPALLYGILFIGQTFVQTEQASKGAGVGDLIRECANPLFLLMLFCMLFTAATELGTNQWISTLLEGKLAYPILVLVLINGIMALGRAFAGEMVHRLSPTGMLVFSAVFSAIGLFLLSSGALWVGVVVFAVGICYFWPTMIGFVSEYTPKTGALGMSLMGGAGMLSVSLVIPFMGDAYDTNKASALDQLKASASPETTFDVLAKQAESMAGLQTLGQMVVLPVVLALIFGALFMLRKRFEHTTH